MIPRITLFSGSGQLWRLDTSNLVWELFINWLFDPILLMPIILPIHCPLKGQECRGCNNTRTDALTFLWNPSQSFFFEHFSTKTPPLAFKLLLTFHGFEQTTGEIIKIFVTMSRILWSLDTDTFEQSVRWDVINTSLSAFHRLRKWSPSLHIIIARKNILFTMVRYFFSMIRADIFHFNFSINFA